MFSLKGGQFLGGELTVKKRANNCCHCCFSGATIFSSCKNAGRKLSIFSYNVIEAIDVNMCFGCKSPYRSLNRMKICSYGDAIGLRPARGINSK